MIQLAKRLQGVGEYYFSKKLKEIDELNKAGMSVINLGIGSPDLPPHADVIRELQDQSTRRGVHGYQSYRGSPVFREAVAKWYQREYNVSLNPADEILPLIGSKEGIMHICMTYLNDGDKVLTPNPGYPTYRSAVTLAGGVCMDYFLTEEGNYFPDLKDLETSGLEGVKMMFVNYPHMPTGATASKEQFESLVQFAKRNKILLVHDNPYSFILNLNPMSILSVDGAMDVAVELNSLSKSHNMAGWRVGMICGARERIEEILRFKSNMDSGMFLPVQLAAATALSLPESWYDSINEVYKKRRELAIDLMRDLLHCSIQPKQVGLFLWGRIPDSSGTGYDLSDEILHNAAVFITPGGIFGSAGDKYLRVSLTSTEERFQEAIDRIKNTRA